MSCFINNTVHDYKSEDSAVVMLFFANGAIGTIDTFFCIPDNSSKNESHLFKQFRSQCGCRVKFNLHPKKRKRRTKKSLLLKKVSLKRKRKKPLLKKNLLLKKVKSNYL